MANEDHKPIADDDAPQCAGNEPEKPSCTVGLTTPAAPPQDEFGGAGFKAGAN
jgi:hypothetical protein